MTDIVRKLIGKYPHVALGCCGVILFISTFVAASNLGLIFPHLGWYWGTHRWLMLTVLIAQLTSVAISVIMVGGAILWGLRRRRSSS